MSYSPVLAVLTAVFELAAAAWVLMQPGRKGIVRTTAAILVFLAGYQIIEAVLCTLAPGSPLLPRVAFMVVTWLPPLGVLLVSFLVRSGAWAVRWFAYAMFSLAAGIVMWIGIDQAFATLSVCEAVYARYDHALPGFLAYSAYY